jgi:hypothetical protein
MTATTTETTEERTEAPLAPADERREALRQHLVALRGVLAGGLGR